MTISSCVASEGERGGGETRERREEGEGKRENRYWGGEGGERERESLHIYIFKHKQWHETSSSFVRLSVLSLYSPHVYFPQCIPRPNIITVMSANAHLSLHATCFWERKISYHIHRLVHKQSFLTTTYSANHSLKRWTPQKCNMSQ